MPKNLHSLNHKAWTQAYLERFQHKLRDLLPVASRFLITLTEQVQELLKTHHVHLGTPIEGRVKTWPSIEAKLNRRHFGGASLIELDDFVGIRVILLFHRDLARTCDLLRSTFNLIRERDKAEDLGETSFGYQYVHLVVKLPKQWFKVPTFASFEELKAEIQVRTMPQHLWAAASHVLQYKQEAGVPAPVRRSLSRVSALLETVDTEFERVLQQREEYRASLVGDLGQRALNVDIVAATLDEMLPAANRRAYEPYSLILWELKALGVNTARQFRDVIERHLEVVLAHEAEIVGRRGQRIASQEAGEPLSEPLFFFSHTGLLRLVLAKEFGEGFYREIWEKISERYR